MEVLDVKLAKRCILSILDSTNQLVQSFYREVIHGSLFIAVIRHLLGFSMKFGFCLSVAVEAKQQINERKYPSDLNQGVVINYKLVSRETGIIESTASEAIGNLTELHSTEPMTAEWMDAFLNQSKAFVKVRKWCKYDQPTNLCLALMEEVGELCGVLKFVSDNQAEVTSRIYGDMVSEICNVFIYFGRLADVCGLFEDIKKEATG
jgi:hypothetical protein